MHSSIELVGISCAPLFTLLKSASVFSAFLNCWKQLLLLIADLYLLEAAALALAVATDSSPLLMILPHDFSVVSVLENESPQLRGQ